MVENRPSDEDLIRFLEGRWNLESAVLDLEESSADKQDSVEEESEED